MLVFRRQSRSIGHRCEGPQIYRLVVVDSHVQRIVLATEETTVIQQVSHIDLSNANPACGHKEVRRSTGHIMVTTRYADQPGSKSRQKVLWLYKQWHRPISERFIKHPYSIYIESNLDRLEMLSPTHDQRSQQEKLKKYALPTSFPSMPTD